MKYISNIAIWNYMNLVVTLLGMVLSPCPSCKQGWTEFLTIWSLSLQYTICSSLAVSMYTCVHFKGQYKLIKQCFWLTLQKWNTAFHIIEFLLLPCVLGQSCTVIFGKWQKWLLMTNTFLINVKITILGFLVSIVPSKSFWSDWFLGVIAFVQFRPP